MDMDSEELKQFQNFDFWPPAIPLLLYALWSSSHSVVELAPRRFVFPFIYL